MFDLTPATAEAIRAVGRVDDSQLDDPTPCEEMSVAGLLEHLVGVAATFTAAAERHPAATTGTGLAPDWRTSLPAGLRGLARAWEDPAAWEGTTETRLGEIPARLAARIALDEVVMHGWDLAMAIGADYEPAPELLDPLERFVRSTVERGPSPGLFAPPVPVPADAARFDQILGLAGRDPAWTPPSA